MIEFRCAPVIVYAVLSIAGLITDVTTGKKSPVQYVGNVVTDLLVIALIAWLCGNGHKTLAWTIVFLPLILFVLLFVLLLLFYKETPSASPKFSFSSFL